MADKNQTIIIKKIKKGGGGHHGGAWKVAYADFVTAMMAFFLLLWLLNSVTQEQLEGIADYFAPTATISLSNSGSGGILAGKSMTEVGAMVSSASQTSVTMEMAPPKAGAGSEDSESAEEKDLDAAKDELEKLEEEQFKEAEESLRKAIESIPSLRRLADSLLIDNTPEGLRIQIVDQKGLAMFPSGNAEMYLHTRKVLELVAKVILSMPQKLAISGHTDAVKFVSDNGYSNWELSSDRANASRRALIEMGVPFSRVARVVGKAATEPLIADNAFDPRNRRLSIVLLRGTGHKPKVTPEKELAPEKELEKSHEPTPDESVTHAPVAPTKPSSGNSVSIILE